MKLKYILVFGVYDWGEALVLPKTPGEYEIYNTRKELQDRVLILSRTRWSRPFYAATYSPANHPGGRGFLLSLTKYYWSLGEGKLIAESLDSKIYNFRSELDKVYFDFQQSENDLDVKSESFTTTATLWEGTKGESRVAQLVLMALEDFSKVRDNDCPESFGFLDVDIRTGPFGVMLTFATEGKNKTYKKSRWLSMGHIEGTELPPNEFYAEQIWPIVKEFMEKIELDREYFRLRKSFGNYESETQEEYYVLGAWNEQHRRFWYLENNWLTDESRLIWTVNRDRAPVFNKTQRKSLGLVVDYINEFRSQDDSILCTEEVELLNFIPIDCECWRCQSSKEQESSNVR